jgi:chromosome segregation ATPase
MPVAWSDAWRIAMPDVGDQLEKVEQGLTELRQRMDERFGQVDQRFAQVDQQFAQVDQRFAQVDQRFAQVDQRFAQVDQRFAQVDQRFDRVDERIDSLATDVQKLRVLGEDSALQIKLVAEVQAHHGSVLDQIKEAVEPLKSLRPLFEQVAGDHEKRITALEGHQPSHTDARFRE